MDRAILTVLALLLLVAPTALADTLTGKVVKITDGDSDVCLEQVKAGFAWHYKKYQHEQNTNDQRLYADAEIRARDERLGLWRENNPNPPWEYRRLYRSQ